MPAERVFLRRGLQGSSVEEIVAEAGFTRGAFYSNFKSKDELFVELLQNRVYRRYAEMADEAQEQPGTPRERLRWGIERVRDVQKPEGGNVLFRLWLECLTQAARDEEFRKLAATFWSGNRESSQSRRRAPSTKSDASLRCRRSRSRRR